MPAYFDFGNHNLSAATTETVRYLLLTPAAGTTSRVAVVTGLFANGQNNGAGGGYIIGCTFTTPGITGGTGTSIIPNKANANSEAAAGLLVNQSPQTTGTGARADRITVGWAQTGGQGGWIAVTPDAGKVLAPGGLTGANPNGNMQLHDLANGASQLFTFVLEFYES